MSAVQAYTIELTGELSLRQTKEVFDTFSDALAKYEAIIVEGAAIAELDTSIVQLFVSAFKSADAQGKSFTVRFPAESALDKVLQRAGFITSEAEPLTAERDLWSRNPN